MKSSVDKAKWEKWVIWDVIWQQSGEYSDYTETHEFKLILMREKKQWKGHLSETTRSNHSTNFLLWKLTRKDLYIYPVFPVQITKQL